MLRPWGRGSSVVFFEARSIRFGRPGRVDRILAGTAALYG